MSEKCAFIKPDGSRCGVWSQKNSEFCYFHDPRHDPKEIGKKGAAASILSRELNDIVVDLGEKDPTVFVLGSMMKMAKDALASGQKPTPNTVKAITAMLREIDLMLERRRDRVPAETRVTVEFVNDWRDIPEPEDTEGEATVSSPGATGGPEAGQEAELASVRQEMA
jgi:hypothetical protein